MQKFSNKAKGGVVLMIVFVLIFIWISLSGGSGTSATPKHLGIGDQGTLAASSTVGVSKDAYDAFFKAASANDATGYYQLQESGQIYDLSTDTKVLVLDSSWGDDQVRLLDGPHIGQTAWVGYESITP